MNETNDDRVAILLCTYNSQKFLVEQLDSIFIQSHTNWHLWVSDDGSQDNTLEILKRYKTTCDRSSLSAEIGPQNGVALNFLSLVNNQQMQSDYYAYSDHDDVWLSNKLHQALEWLKTIPKEIPALYCGRTVVVDSNLNTIGLSPLFSLPASFANAIVQNIGGGNTMVFNNAARKLLNRVDLSNGIVAHDWLTYQVVSACGGKVFYDASPTISYRQHDGNIVGANNNYRARIVRIRMLLKGTFREWSTSNLAVIESLGTSIDAKNRLIINHVHLLKSKNFLIRIKELLKLKIYRQTWMGNLGLVVAIIMRRL